MTQSKSLTTREALLIYVLCYDIDIAPLKGGRADKSAGCQQLHRTIRLRRDLSANYAPQRPQKGRFVI